MAFKIKVHIFSFDRPAQLDLLLRSLYKYDVNKIFYVSVQYLSSNDDSKLGYQLLINKFQQVNFIQENYFNKNKITFPLKGHVLLNLLLWLSNYRFRKFKTNFRSLLLDSLEDEEYDFFMFLTDDSLFYKNIQISEDVLKLLCKYVKDSYSLALGKNINDGKYEVFKNQVVWKVSSNFKDNYRYPFSVDGRIYNRRYLLKLTKNIIFMNPNTYESAMVLQHSMYNIFDKLIANEESCLVGFELNRVQNTYLNKSLGISHKELNKYFTKGYSLNIDFDKNNVVEFRPVIKEISVTNQHEKILIYKPNIIKTNYNH